MLRIPRSLVAGLLALIVGPAACVASCQVVISRDRSTEDTIGVTYQHGFPIWFHGWASGGTLFGTWEVTRMLANGAFWTTVAFVALLSLFGMLPEWRWPPRLRSQPAALVWMITRGNTHEVRWRLRPWLRLTFDGEQIWLHELRRARRVDVDDVMSIRVVARHGRSRLVAQLRQGEVVPLGPPVPGSEVAKLASFLSDGLGCPCIKPKLKLTRQG